MNQGVFGFSPNLTSTAETLKEFDSSGSYVIPPGAKILRILPVMSFHCFVLF